MRSAIIAAFAAGAIAVPHHMHKPRALVTDYDIVYVTECVTVTEGASSAAPTGDSKYNNHWHWTSHSKPAQHTTVSVKPQTSTIYVAPTSVPAVSSIVSSVVSQIPSSAPAPESTIVYTVPASQPAYSAPASSAPAPGPTSSPSQTGDDYKDAIVNAHNQNRAKHSAPALEWDDELAQTAQTIAEKCVWGHDTSVINPNGGYGQNIASGIKKGDITTCVSDMWYGSEQPKMDGLWGQDNLSMADIEKVGHFTQVIWKETSKVGCYTADCSANGLANSNSDIPPFFTVCNYQNTGNVEGYFAANVLSS